MNIRVMKPFIFLAMIMLIVSAACLNTGGKTPTEVPEIIEPDIPSSEEQPAGSTGAVDNLDDVQGAVFQIIGTGTINTVEDGEILNAEWGGTGFFIDSSGIGVTNNHVVAGAALIKAYVNGETRARNVTVLGTSECADLAVVQVQGDDFPYLEWFDGSVKTGLAVYAAGFPLVEPEYNLTKGIISKVNAVGETNWASLDYIYGHDAKINGGNSGGPLVTQDGQVVGVNYMTRSSVDQQFAIPAELAIPIVETLQEEENVASVGLAGSAVVFGPNSEYPGIWVESITTGGIADKAGIQPGDIIHEVETILIATDGSMKDYCDILKGHRDGDQIKVMIYRPQTDEILEGSLNESPLEVTSTGVLGGTASGEKASGTTSSESSEQSETGIFTEFDGDLTTEGWYSYVFDQYNPEASGTVTQKTGRMEVKVDTDRTEVYVFNDNLYTSDVIVKARVTKVAGPNRMNACVVCRATDLGWYEFAITYGGYVQVWKWDANAGDNGYYYRLAEKGSTAIKTATGGENELEAHCIGTNLTFYVNGVQVANVQDRDFTEGKVGVSVYTFDIKGSVVDFENFSAEIQ